ncbi:hypothetical protein BVIET440_340016 [Burkholderia vietnamiensis]
MGRPRAACRTAAAVRDRPRQLCRPRAHGNHAGARTALRPRDRARPRDVHAVSAGALRHPCGHRRNRRLADDDDRRTRRSRAVPAFQIPDDADRLRRQRGSASDARHREGSVSHVGYRHRAPDPRVRAGPQGARPASLIHRLIECGGLRAASLALSIERPFPIAKEFFSMGMIII